MAKIALVFSKPLDFSDVLAPMGAKRSVYEELFRKLQKRGHNAVIVTTKSYIGDGVFNGYWSVTPGRTELQNKEIKVDVVYDRSGGLKFPRESDNLRVIDNLSFKNICWNKWLAYKELYEYMPVTFWVGTKKNLPKVLKEMSGDTIVLKPHNGLKGIGVFIGKKNDVDNFEFDTKLPQYIAQEFVDTSGGISGICEGTHDLRCVIINKKIVWSHVRVPPKGQFKANTSAGAGLSEVEVSKLPYQVVEICIRIAKVFYERYDNPIYSLDFGVGPTGQPYLFEVNDQMGFPLPTMKAKNLFLDEMINNLESKL